ncbi:MAG: phosphoglycerate dehydrogenase [Bacteroidia bacterium]|nr:phosphoglycerate dehydrogenase [Bacteroidia bacterium]
MEKAPPNPEQKYFVFDFDSTFIRVEGLEELASIALKGHPDRKSRLKKIADLTDRGIDGTISFTDGLTQRLQLIEANRAHLEKLVRKLRDKVSVSIKRNRAFFSANRDQIIIISAGFREFIEPIVAEFGIPPTQVFANTFTFNSNGDITGFDAHNVLSTTEGKLDQMKALQLKGKVFVIGDGYSDFRMKAASENVHFHAFTENVQRKSAIAAADHVTPSFDEFLYHHRMPMALSFPKNRIKVLLLENIHPDAEAFFKQEGYEVERLVHTPSEDELIEKIKEVHVIGIRSKTELNERVLKKAKKLICIGAFCIGTNQIDLEVAQELGIAVFNAPFSNTRSVVELVIGEIIMLMRGIPDKNALMHAGIWEKSADGSQEVRGKTLGIVGYGNIGSQLSVLAEGLGMKVLFFDKVDKLALGNAQRCTSLKELLRKSDIVTLHVDGDPANSNMFGEAEFKQMKKGSIFLNLSRGFVVEISALAQALKSGKIRGASVDVFPVEPSKKQEPFASELIGLPNLILTPHIGGSTQEAQKDIGTYVPDKLVSYINSGNTFNSVNFPNLQLPELKNSHRLIHIHQNVPGILAKINIIFAQHGINITGQHLKTNEIIGYVITDIDKEYDQKVIKELKDIEGTLKFRVLY